MQRPERRSPPLRRRVAAVRRGQLAADPRSRACALRKLHDPFALTPDTQHGANTCAGDAPPCSSAPRHGEPCPSPETLF